MSPAPPAAPAHDNSHPDPSPDSAASRASRHWARVSESFLGVACALACPPTRSFAWWLAMGGGPILAGGPILTGGAGTSADRTRSATWSSLRGRDPVDLERHLRGCFERLFEGTPPAVDLIESRFRAVAHPGLSPLPLALRRRRLRDLQDAQEAARFRPLPGAASPDHLAVELHFLAHLLARASQDAANAGPLVRQAGQMAIDHVLSWLPGLRAAIRDQGGHEFYLASVIVAEAAARAVAQEASMPGTGHRT